MLVMVKYQEKNINTNLNLANNPKGLFRGIFAKTVTIIKR